MGCVACWLPACTQHTSCGICPDDNRTFLAKARWRRQSSACAAAVNSVRVSIGQVRNILRVLCASGKPAGANSVLSAVARKKTQPTCDEDGGATRMTTRPRVAARRSISRLLYIPQFCVLCVNICKHVRPRGNGRSQIPSGASCAKTLLAWDRLPSTRNDGYRHDHPLDASSS
jgi:hypothetical protein